MACLSSQSTQRKVKSFRVSKDTCCSGAVRSSGTAQHREQDVAKPVKPVQSANHLAYTIQLRHDAPADLLKATLQLALK